MSTRTVTGTWRSFDGAGPRSPRTGTITFEPSTLVRDAISNHIVVQDPVVAELDANGQISVQLQVTDDANLNPVGWFWVVTERITGLTARRYQMLLPGGLTAFDLSDIEVPYSAVPIDPDEIYIRGFEALSTVLDPDELPTLDYEVVNSVGKVTFNLPRAADITIGTVAAGTGPSDASVTDSGTDGDVVLDFTVPRTTLDVGTTTPLLPNQNPTVANSGTDGEAVFDFSIPRAATVTTGTVTVVNPDQPPSAAVSATANGDALVNFDLPRAPDIAVGSVSVGVDATDASVTDVGADGDVQLDFKLPRTTVDVGTTTVVGPDQDPSVTNSGTDAAAVLDFNLPRAADVSVGTVTTLPPGSSAAVTDVGVNGDVVLDFDLPKGADGTGTAYYGQMSSQTTQTVDIISTGAYVPMAITGTFDTANSFGMVAPTTASFGVKNDSGATQLVTVVATADVEIGNNKTAGFRLAVNGTAVPETTCTATTGTANFAKLMTQWFVELGQGDEVSLLVANLTDTTDIDVDRSKIIVFTAGRQGEQGVQGVQGEPGVVTATAPITYDSGTQTIAWSGDTDDVPEGSNLYYTDARADARAIVFAIALGG